MTLTDTTLDSMRTDLVSGVSRHNRRRTRRRMAAIVPVAAIGAAVALVATQSGGSPAFALTELADGSIRVEVFPEFDDVDALQASLRDAGLNTSVVHLRADPTLEGVIEVASHTNESSGALEFDNGEFIIDVGAVEGEVEILIYSETEPGSDYQAAPSVFAPGQPLAGLHCAFTDQALTTVELEQRAIEAGIDAFEWTTFGETDPETGAVETLESSQRPAGFVAGAQMLNAETLSVIIRPEDPGPAAETISMSDGTHYRIRPTCTPELANAWN